MKLYDNLRHSSWVHPSSQGGDTSHHLHGSYMGRQPKGAPPLLNVESARKVWIKISSTSQEITSLWWALSLLSSTEKWLLHGGGGALDHNFKDLVSFLFKGYCSLVCSFSWCTLMTIISQLYIQIVILLKGNVVVS